MADPRSLDLADLARLPDPYPVDPLTSPPDTTVWVPGSKSITNRALVCAALADGTSVLDGVGFSDDSEAMLGVIETLGLRTRIDRDACRVAVDGCAGLVPTTDDPLDVRQSGTTARFVPPLLALGAGAYRIVGHPQLLARPMDATFEALRDLGAAVEEAGAPGHLPATVRGGGIRGGLVRVPGDVSSQFLSGLLLSGPCLPEGLVVEVTTPLVSRPYVDLTAAVMRSFGASVEMPDRSTFAVAPGGYRATHHTVEPDASAAAYFFAAAAIAGGRVRVEGLGRRAQQGDMAFLDVLDAMGAEVRRDDDSTTVVGTGRLRGIDADLTDISDTAQTLAVTATFADQPSRITGIGFIRGKETDRVAAVVAELRRCGIGVTVDDDGWTVTPGHAAPTVIRTYGDHRMAMSFALLGLVTPGIAIADPTCVAKTFPTFWAALDGLRRQDRADGPVRLPLR